MKKSIQDNWASRLVNYTMNLFITSFYFLVLNIPIIILYLLVTLNSEAMPGLLLTYICFLPLGPAFTAVLSMAINILTKGELEDITKRFFKFYKENFKQAIIIWSLSLFAMMILYVDVKYTSSKLKPIFYILLAYIFIIANYALLYVSKFYLKLKDILRLAYMSTFKYGFTSIAMLGMFIILGFLAYKLVYIGIILFTSAYAFGLAFYCKKPIKEISEIIMSE